MDNYKWTKNNIVIKDSMQLLIIPVLTLCATNSTMSIWMAQIRAKCPKIPVPKCLSLWAIILAAKSSAIFNLFGSENASDNPVSFVVVIWNKIVLHFKRSSTPMTIIVH